MTIRKASAKAAAPRTVAPKVASTKPDKRATAGGARRPTSSPTDRPTHPNAAAFPDGISGPALRALAGAGIRTIGDLARWTEADLDALHGMGPKARELLSRALIATGRSFRR